MTLPAAKKRYTPAEYYRLERDAAYKSDYYDGDIFAMARGTGEHSQITSNVIVALGMRLRGKSCVVRESNQLLKIGANGLRTYPDVSVYCGPVQYDPEDPDHQTALNPTVLIEVLSPSTEGYDRGFKAESYRRVESLRAYALVAQDRPHVELYERQSNGAWLLREAGAVADVIRIQPLDLDLPLAEVYDRVEFPANPASPLAPQG